MLEKRALLQVPLVDLRAQYSSIAQEINEVTARVLGEADFILGREVDLFEADFAVFCQAEHAVGVASGMSALELALRAYGVGPGDEVITAANTFIATALAISSTGATPVLVDINPDTYTMEPAELERAIGPQTRAVIPVHLYGQPADMDAILKIAAAKGLIVIEDACQAHGARYKGRRVGCLGHAGAFSFYPGKNLGAYGDGGAMVTDDEVVAERVRVLRNYGQQEKYHHVLQGFNLRLDTLQAAVLRVKLKYLDDWNAARTRHARLYGQLLQDLGAGMPVVAPDADSVWHLYVIRADNRDSLCSALKSGGIATGIHYPVPIHLQPAFSTLGHRRGDFPITESYADQILSLPMYPELSPVAIKHIGQAILHFHSKRQPASSLA